MTSSRSAPPASADGADARSPWAMPWPAWKAVLLRSWRETNDDNVGLVAAGVAFYGFLALVPLLGALVLSYGLVAEPDTVVRNVKALTAVMPADAARLIGEQLMNVVETSGAKKGFGVLLALALALFGARNGAGAIMIALNIAYEEKEKRSFLRVNATALAITGGAVVAALFAVVAIAALGHLEALLPAFPDALLVIGKLLSYILLLLAGTTGAALLYRYGPSRRRPRWMWLTPGSALTALLWLMLTLGFGLYVANFGNYDATYGSLGAVVVLLTWLYLSAYILIFGAELNCELEHQTAQDTTRGPAKPLGTRGAWAADHVAGADGGARRDAPPATVAPPRSTIAQEWAAARAAARLARHARLEKVGLAASGAATLGLALLRRRGSARQGAALLAAAAAIAWLRREDADAPARPRAD